MRTNTSYARKSGKISGFGALERLEKFSLIALDCCAHNILRFWLLGEGAAAAHEDTKQYCL